MDKTYRIPSNLYFQLYKKGGDKLISVYSILKTSRNGEIKYYSFQSRNNKIVSGYSLLRNKTNLTLHSLKKYVPLLIELNLCWFDNNGDFILLGNEKTKSLFRKNDKKLVPIKIGKNLTHTAYNVLSVRFHSSESKQLKQIEKKHIQRELLSRKDDPRSLKELKQIRKILKYDKPDSYFIDKCVLSTTSYAYIKDCSDSKSKGAYWKNVLKQKNIITTSRRFEEIKKMSLKEFLKLKSSYKMPKILVYRNGHLVKELVSSFKTINLPKVSVKN